MEITRKELTYKTANYRFDIEADNRKTWIYVFDLKNNLICSFESIKEAETIARELTEVLEKLKI